MKQIDLYLIEKLKINKYTSSYISSDKYGVDWVITDIPVCDNYDQIIYQSKVWRTLEMPKSTYVIYNDFYRLNRPHLADTGDFLINMCWDQDDYEDFNPKKDILYASNNLKDILEWYFNYLGIKEFPKDEDDLYEWEAKYENKNLKINDDIRVLGEFYLGIDNYYDDCEEFTFDKDEIEKQLGYLQFKIE